MAGNYRFRGLLSRLHPLRAIEEDVHLRRFRQHIEGRLTGDPGTKRVRAQRIVEAVLISALDDFSAHYVDGIVHHVEEVGRIRSLIREQYHAIVNVNPDRANFPTDIAGNLTRLFGELETHLSAIENHTGARHLKTEGQGLPLDGLRSTLDDLTSAEPPRRRSAAEAAAERIGETPASRPRRHGPPPPEHLRPDISGRFEFGERVIDGEQVKYGRGELGEPGHVQTHRDENAQAAVSSGTGDDAGHLIGDRFGAEGTRRNLAPQEWRTNQFGTFKELENRWDNLLHEGHRVEVDVRDHTLPGENRPYRREVTYWVTDVETGARTEYKQTFGNFDSARRREALARQGVQP